MGQNLAPRCIYRHQPCTTSLSVVGNGIVQPSVCLDHLHRGNIGGANGHVTMAIQFNICCKAGRLGGKFKFSDLIVSDNVYHIMFY